MICRAMFRIKNGINVLDQKKTVKYSQWKNEGGWYPPRGWSGIPYVTVLSP